MLLSPLYVFHFIFTTDMQGTCCLRITDEEGLERSKAFLIALIGDFLLYHATPPDFSCYQSGLIPFLRGIPFHLQGVGEL